MKRYSSILLLLILVLLVACTVEPTPPSPAVSYPAPDTASSPETTNEPVTETSRNSQLPIYIVYVNHVEVESVLPGTAFPLINGATYTTSEDSYTYTRAQIEWEVAQAEAVGGSISFHMSGAFAERALNAGDKQWWKTLIGRGHTVDVHAHTFIRGPEQFEWIYRLNASPDDVSKHWQDNHDLVEKLTDSEPLIGESHYNSPASWKKLGYSLMATEVMASLPAGEHIVWRVERNPLGVVTYPHFPQIGTAGPHGPVERRLFFDLRLPQLKKEFLMLYLEWLERERIGAAPQVWAFGWCNHGGIDTQRYAAEIEEMLTWLKQNFLERPSYRGNTIASFVNDHEFLSIYEDYEQWGTPLPSQTETVTDFFPYMADILKDAGVVGDLSSKLALDGVRLIELERNPPGAQSGAGSQLYLLFRENDGPGQVDLSDVLQGHQVITNGIRLFNVKDGTSRVVDSESLFLGTTPLVFELLLNP